MRFSSVGVCASLILMVAGVVRGQELTPPAVLQPTADPLTVERIEQLRKEAAESGDLGDEAKKIIAEIYRSSLVELQRGEEFAAHAAACNNDAESVEQRVAQKKQQLEELKARESSIPEDAELEQALTKVEVQLAAQKKAQAAAESEPKRRAARRKEIRARLLAIPGVAKKLQQQFASLPADEHALVIAARRTDLEARQLTLHREVPALQNELAKYDAEDAADLVRFQRDVCTQEVASTERYLQLLKEHNQKVRTAAAAKAVRKARDEALAAAPEFATYTERNRHLAEAAESMTERFDVADRDLKTAEEVHEQLLRQFELTRKKVESVGLTHSVGALLRKQRAALPDLRHRRAAVSGRQATIDEAQYQLFEYDDERQELADPDSLVQRILEKSRPSRAEDPVLKAAAHEVLACKREYLDALIRNHNKYFDTLVELDTAERQIIALTEQYQQYIDERVLWIRSGNLLSSELKLDPSDAWMISGKRWAEVPLRFWVDLKKHPLPYGFAVLLFAVLAVRGGRLRRELHEAGETARRPTCLRFGKTLRCVGITVAIAGMLPLAIGFASWRLGLAAHGSPFAKAVAHGLFCVFVMWVPLEVLRQVCRPNGVAEAHFLWPSSAAQLLRRSLRWLILASLPLTFVTSTLFASDPTHGRDAVERTCFVLQAIVYAVFLRRVLRPSGGRPSRVHRLPSRRLDRPLETRVALAGDHGAVVLGGAGILGLLLHRPGAFLADLRDDVPDGLADRAPRLAAAADSSAAAKIEHRAVSRASRGGAAWSGAPNPGASRHRDGKIPSGANGPQRADPTAAVDRPVRDVAGRLLADLGRSASRADHA